MNSFSAFLAWNFKISRYAITDYHLSIFCLGWKYWNFVKVVAKSVHTERKDLSPLHATIETYEQFLQFWITLDNLRRFWKKINLLLCLFHSFFFGHFWSLLVAKLRKYKNIAWSLFISCKARWAKQKENQTTKVTKIPKIIRQKYGMKETELM